MTFKIDINKIVNSLSKEFGEKTLSNSDHILKTELEKQNLKIKEIKEKEKLIDLEFIKSKIIVPVKIEENLFVKKTLIKDFNKNNENPITEREIKEKIKDKEINLISIKQIDIMKEKPSFQKTELISLGKNLFIIGSNIFNNDFEKFFKDDIVSNDEKFIDDLLRGRTGKFWTRNIRNVEFVANLEQDIGGSVFNFDFYGIQDVVEKSDFGRTIQVVSIEAIEKKFLNAKNKFSKELFNSFVLGKKYEGSTRTRERIDKSFTPSIKENIIFNDYAILMSLPFSNNELKKYGDFRGVKSGDIKTKYNFFIEDYEKNIVDKTIFENTLPNMYVMLAENNSIFPNPEFLKLITLNNIIKTDSKKIILSRTKNKELNKSRVYDLKTNPLGEYYDLFGRQYKNAARGDIEELNKKFSNLIISSDDIDFIQKFNSKKELFPMTTHIKFSVDKTAQFVQILKDTKFLDEFVGRVAGKVNKNEFKFLAVQQAEEEIVEITRRK